MFTVAALAQQPVLPHWCAKVVTEKLTDHVWAIRHEQRPARSNVRNHSFGTNVVLVVDNGMGARNAETVLREVAKVGGGKPIYIVTTHVHPEHDMGAHAFPAGSKLIRSTNQVGDIEAGAGMRLAPIFAARSQLNTELLTDAHHREADFVFEGRYTLDLGGVKARIQAMGTDRTYGETAWCWSMACCSPAISP